MVWGGFLPPVLLESAGKPPGYDPWVGFSSLGSVFNPMLTPHGKLTFHNGFSNFIVAGLAVECIREVAKGAPAELAVQLG